MNATWWSSKFVEIYFRCSVRKAEMVTNQNRKESRWKKPLPPWFSTLVLNFPFPDLYRSINSSFLTKQTDKNQQCFMPHAVSLETKSKHNKVTHMVLKMPCFFLSFFFKQSGLISGIEKILEMIISSNVSHKAGMMVVSHSSRNLLKFSSTCPLLRLYSNIENRTETYGRKW